jgi:hypothetical protein
MTDKAIKPPTPLARQYVRLVVGFSVGVGLGMAPFLGRLEIPGFVPLLSLYPDDLQDPLVATGAFLMGVVAVVIQFYAGERVSRADVRRLFRRTLIVVGVALVLLVVLWVLFVESVPTPGEPARFVITSERLLTCPCDAAISNVECIQRLGAGPGSVSRCWSDQAVKLAWLALFASYFLLTGGFGALIGLLLLQKAAKQQEAARAAKRRRKAKREPAPEPADAAD